MTLPHPDWPSRLPPPPSNTSECDLCHDLVLELESTNKGDSKGKCQLKAFYWSWERYGPYCQFCNAVREIFWYVAETLGYTRYKLHEDFWYLHVSVSFKQEAFIITIQPKNAPKPLASKWAHQQWYLALPLKGKWLSVCSSQSNAYGD